MIRPRQRHQMFAPHATQELIVIVVRDDGSELRLGISTHQLRPHIQRFLQYRCWRVFLRFHLSIRVARAIVTTHVALLQRSESHSILPFDRRLSLWHWSHPIPKLHFHLPTRALESIAVRHTRGRRAMINAQNTLGTFKRVHRSRRWLLLVQWTVCRAVTRFPAFKARPVLRLDLGLGTLCHGVPLDSAVRT